MFVKRWLSLFLFSLCYIKINCNVSNTTENVNVNVGKKCGNGEIFLDNHCEELPLLVQYNEKYLRNIIGEKFHKKLETDEDYDYGKLGRKKKEEKDCDVQCKVGFHCVNGKCKRLPDTRATNGFVTQFKKLASTLKNHTINLLKNINNNIRAGIKNIFKSKKQTCHSGLEDKNGKCVSSNKNLQNQAFNIARNVLKKAHTKVRIVQEGHIRNNTDINEGSFEHVTVNPTEIFEDVELKCKKDFELIDGKCKRTHCKKDFEYKNGKCIKITKIVDVIEQTTEILEYLCPNNSQYIDGECRKMSCRKGFHLENGKCVKRSKITGHVKVEEAMLLEVICPEGYEHKDGKCRKYSCTEGFKLENGVCVLIDSKENLITEEANVLQYICPSGFHYYEGKCIKLKCKPGFELIESKCFAVNQADIIIQDEAEILEYKCSPGYNYIDGKCIRKKCKDGFVLTKNSDKCEKMRTEEYEAKIEIVDPSKIICPAGFEYINHKCRKVTCAKGFQLLNGRCIEVTGMSEEYIPLAEITPPLTLICPDGYTLVSERCRKKICKKDYNLVNDLCVRSFQPLNTREQVMDAIDFNCPEGFDKRGEDRKCVRYTCKEGFDLIMQKCVNMKFQIESSREVYEPVEEIVDPISIICPFDFEYVNDQCRRWVCVDGYEFSAEGICVSKSSYVVSYTCPENFKYIDGKCKREICKPNWILRDNKCFGPKGEIEIDPIYEEVEPSNYYCPPGYKLHQDKCKILKCEESYELKGDRCVKKDEKDPIWDEIDPINYQCPPGTTPKDRKCLKQTCEKGFQLMDDKCVSTGEIIHSEENTTPKSMLPEDVAEPVKCPDGYKMISDKSKNEKCQRKRCPTGYNLKKNKCIRESWNDTLSETIDPEIEVVDPINICPPGYIYLNDKCYVNKMPTSEETNSINSCPSGFIIKSGKCELTGYDFEKPSIICQPGYNFEDEKCIRLKCPEGLKLEKKICIKGYWDSPEEIGEPLKEYVQPIYICPFNYTLVNDRCVQPSETNKSDIPPEQYYDSSQEVVDIIRCPDDYTYTHKKCRRKTCPHGYKFKHSKCYKEKLNDKSSSEIIDPEIEVVDPINKCPPDFTYKNDKCYSIKNPTSTTPVPDESEIEYVCPHGYKLKNEKCAAFIKCPYGFKLMMDKCIKYMQDVQASQEVYDPIEDIVDPIPCPINYIKDGKCLEIKPMKCPKDYMLEHKICKKQYCPHHWKLNNTLGKCYIGEGPTQLIMDAYVDSILSTPTCPTNYKLMNNKCYFDSTSSDTDVKTATLICPPGYMLNSREKCVRKKCPEGYQLKDEKCETEGWITNSIVDPEEELIEPVSTCPFNYVYKNGKCIVDSPPTTENSILPNIGCPEGYNLNEHEKCMKLKCANGYKLKGRNCEKNGWINIDYANPEEEVIEPTSTCPIGYKFENGKCFRDHSQTSEYFLSPNSMCPDGYELINGKCQTLHCPDGYKLQNMKCTKVNLIIDAVKKEVNPNLICPTAYILKRGNCYHNDSKQFDDDEAIEPSNCPPGYKFIDNKCQANKCPEGFLVSNGKCSRSKKRDDISDSAEFIIDEIAPTRWCPEQYKLVGLKCIKIKCQGYLINGECSDTDDRISTVNETIDEYFGKPVEPTRCPNHYIYKNRKCHGMKCKTGYIFFNGVCYNENSRTDTGVIIETIDATEDVINPINMCPAGYMYNRSIEICHRRSCTAGQVFYNGRCERANAASEIIILPKCPGRYTYNNGKCRRKGCLDGFKLQNRRCIKTQMDIETSREVYDPIEEVTDALFCPPGYRYKKEKCVMRMCKIGYKNFLGKCFRFSEYNYDAGHDHSESEEPVLIEKYPSEICPHSYKLIDGKCRGKKCPAGFKLFNEKCIKSNSVIGEEVDYVEDVIDGYTSCGDLPRKKNKKCDVLECKEGFTLVNGRCYRNIALGSYEVDQYIDFAEGHFRCPPGYEYIPHFLKCRRMLCKDGTDKNGTCNQIIIDDYDPKMEIAMNNQTCKPGYRFVNGECEISISEPIRRDTENETACAPGYEINAKGQCEYQIETPPEECKPGYIKLANGHCARDILHSVTPSPGDKTKEVCGEGYQLTKEGKCVENFVWFFTVYPIISNNPTPKPENICLPCQLPWFLQINPYRDW